ncbi:hypothetical protein TRSC58_07497 [Trypanosoma rangeli SC58]|uniref:Transmembrane protein n=1 Tax=Trypanosoma rangeli SC58 TaxID=429131 RepID=A0A061ISQ4_TRYRA|nr:hypothetical protein TRSC58_07497 [Trypanosoma rangeli SC58]
MHVRVRDGTAKRMGNTTASQALPSESSKMSFFFPSFFPSFLLLNFYFLFCCCCFFFVDCPFSRGLYFSLSPPTLLQLMARLRVRQIPVAAVGSTRLKK